jgi:RNA polymerase sigma-70 factor (ECF subfamily)
MKGGSDDDDLRALAGGDPDAFAALFRRHQTFVYNVAFRRTASWSAAEDVTGVVFLELWRQRGRVEPLGGSIRPWLAGVAANQARHVWRARSRRADALGRVAGVGAVGRHEPDPADDLADRIDDERAMAALLGRLDALPQAHREVLTLWAWEQLSYDEIAVALAVPVGTVRSRLSRARASLRTLDGTRAVLRASPGEPVSDDRGGVT